MNSPLFVEILSQAREVKYRHKANTMPIRIGRAYDNDVILDDPYIAAHHALIEQTAAGELMIRDLGSYNGIICNGSRQTEMPIDGNMSFRLGHTSLRVRSAEFPVAAEITDSTLYNWEGIRPAMVGLIILVLLGVFNKWVSDTQKFEVIPYLDFLVTWIAVGLAWCGIWAFANKLFGRSTRFGRHLFIMGIGIAAIQIWSIFSSFLAYAFSLEIITGYSGHLVIAICAITVFFHLSTINPRLRRYFALTCVMLAVLGSGLSLMYHYSGTGRLAAELFMSERFPPVVRQSSDKPVTQIISDAKKLKTRADEERTNLTGIEEEE